MDNDIEMPEFSKIKALIPKKLFEELQRKNVFNSNFDNFITQAIIEKLKRDENG